MLVFSTSTIKLGVLLFYVFVAYKYCILAYLHTSILAHFYTSKLSYMHTWILAYLHACILTCLQTCIPAAFEHRQINLNYIYMQRILYSEILKKKIQKNVQFQWKTTTEVQVLRKHIATWPDLNINGPKRQIFCGL